jgi:uncharacterized protein (TIGR03437 family)
VQWWNIGQCIFRDTIHPPTCFPPTVNGSTKTGNDGDFLAADLPADFYYLCAGPVEANQLGTCDWIGVGNSGPTSVDLTNNQQMDNLRLILRRGTLLVVHVKDETNATSRSHFGVGIVFGNGAFLGLRFDASRQAYTIVMPRGISARLWVDTTLLVQDDAGNSLPVDAGILPFTTGDADTQVLLTVTPSLVNAASYLPGVDVGDIATLFGSGFTDVEGVQTASSLPLPAQIGGTSLTVGGIAAPLLAVVKQGGQEQINFQVPHYPGQYYPPPFVFVVNNNGKTQTFYSRPAGSLGVFSTVQHGNGVAITQVSPAAPGEEIVIYWTGLKAFFPFLPDGVPSPPSTPCVYYLNPIVQIGGVKAEVKFCGAAPGLVGVGQINAVVPSTLQSGSYDIRILMGGTYGNSVNLAVQGP